MAAPGTDIVIDGTGQALPAQHRLRAGPLIATYEAGALRSIWLGEHEILRGIYVAVRDHNWDTVPAAISDEQIRAAADSFSIRYTAEHHQGEVDFIWHAAIDGTADGRIRFRMEGQARAGFLRNRIGFCVLHPMSCAGAACTVEHTDGRRVDTTFPQFIAPHQPFKEMRAITHTAAPGLRARVLMTGDTFEMEDQRNWTDASFKTYCTPLDLPYPAPISAGEQVAQEVLLELVGAPPLAASRGGKAGTARLAPADSLTALPLIGLGRASHAEGLTERELGRLRSLNLAHLRADLRLSDPDLAALLEGAAGEARALGVELELALFLSDAAERELAAFVQLLGQIRPPVARWLVFHTDEKSTGAGWLRLARRFLAGYAPQAPLGGGTNAYFTELNRGRPPVEALDLVCYSLNPQVHAFDNRSLVETLAAQRVTVESARHLCGGRPLAVTPVTLRPRFNPNATGPAAEPEPGQLPEQVDVRQMSLFGAAWTLGSLANLATCGLRSLTYYETTGWRGVIEREAGSPLPGRFRSAPGAPFPLFHVLADVGEFAGGRAGRLGSSDTLLAEGLALELAGRTCWLAANLTAGRLRLVLEGLPAQVAVRTLDERTAGRAAQDPLGFRAEPGEIHATNAGRLELELLPYGIVRVEQATTGSL